MTKEARNAYLLIILLGLGLLVTGFSLLMVDMRLDALERLLSPPPAQVLLHHRHGPVMLREGRMLTWADTTI